MIERLGWLDGLRAYAILGVMYVHCVFQSEVNAPQALKFIGLFGIYGVQLFFVISSIAIYMTLAKHRADGQPLIKWYVKRVFRIAPLYYLGILVFVSLGILWADAEFKWLQILANFIFVHGFLPGSINTVVPGGWSFGVEMAFYVVAPLLCFTLRTQKRWPILWSILGVLTLAVTWFASGGKNGFVEENSFFYWWPFTQLPVFLLALALMKWSDAWILTEQRASTRVSVLAILGFGVFMFVAAYFGPVGQALPMLAPMLFGAAFCCLVLLARDWWSPFFTAPFIVHIGRISFSMYIIHFFVIFIFENMQQFHGLIEYLPKQIRFYVYFPIVLVCTYLLSVLSYKFIEKNGMKLGVKLNSALPSFLFAFPKKLQASK